MGTPLVHHDDVWSVAFSPDGRSILTGNDDGHARLWESDLSQPGGRLLEYGSTMSAAVLNRDGKTLLTAGPDGKLRRWEVASGRALGPPLDLGVSISAMAWSPDGTTIATGSDDSTRLWDAATGQPLGPPLAHSGPVTSVAFSPDGKTLLAGSRDNTARLWDAASGQPIGQPLVHAAAVWSVAFSPDGKTVLTGSHDMTARLWDAASGRPLGSPMEHPDPVNSVTFSPDGKIILTGSGDKSAQLWDAAGRSLGRPLPQSDMATSVAYSPDGRTMLIGCADSTARLWDVATGQPIGASIPHPSIPHPFAKDRWEPRVEFTPDGRFLLTSDSRTARVWDVPAPLPDDLPRLAVWVEAATGLELDESGSIRVLDQPAWLERRRRLEQLGGPPAANPLPRLDPILFGGDPTARGNAWKERGMLDRAEAAYAEAIHARPYNHSAWEALAGLHVERGHLDRAGATIADAVRMMPDDLGLRMQLGRALLWSGDRFAWRRSNVVLHDQFGRTSNAWSAQQVAWVCALGPEGTADAEVPVRLAEAALKGAPENNRANYLIALGAVLYRAGRFDEAVRRLEESLQHPSLESRHEYSAFLAMVHHRLGHPDEARRWLDRLQSYQPDSDRGFWSELEIRLLRREAEAVILYDPVFPSDPFGR
jgi:WD40 repeat protein/tetratricopeptide (TPR) repeat protein